MEDTRPLRDLTQEERTKRIADNACVSAKDMRAALERIAALEKKVADMEAARARTA